MKGSEILERFAKAKAAVAKYSGRLGEIGDGLRSDGYEVHYDGFSICNFGERDVKLRYKASSCCGDPWHLCGIVYGDLSWKGGMRVDCIDPQSEYDIAENPSESDLLERGQLRPRAYSVCDTSSGQIREMGEFGSFEEADAYARSYCQREIDRLVKDPDWRPHTATAIRNDPIRAKERGELRHYEYYNYQGHRSWVGVGTVM